MRSRKTAINFPAARAEGLLIERVGSETVVYDVETKEAHCLKGLAAVLFASADGKTAAEDLAKAAEKTLGEPVSFAQVQEAITELESCALLDTPLVVRDGLSRRDLVRKAGYTGAALTAASPLITSILAPTSAMALNSTIPIGCAGCGKNKDCAPPPGDQDGHCCQSNQGKQCNQGCCVGHDNSCHACGCVGNTCNACTVTPTEAGIPQCPCVCGPTCPPPCCPTQALVCCVNTVPQGCN
jgi:hypothetical protein